MKRYKKILAYIAAIIIIIAAGLLVYGVKEEIPQTIEYTSYNTKNEGTRALFLLSKEMGYDVEVYTRTSRFLPDNATVVAIEPDFDIAEISFEKKYLRAWLERGNVLILISKYSDAVKYIKDLGAAESINFGRYDSGYKYSMGEGSIILFRDSDKYTNLGVKDLNQGVQFIEALEEGGYKMVLFNEYYHGIGTGGTKLWDIIGFGGQLVIIQLVLALLIYAFNVSRRFGKPVVVFETIKRQENENLYALSNIYYKAKANSISLEVYFENVKQELAKFLGFGKDDFSDADIIRAVKENNFLRDLEIEAVFLECESYIRNEKNNSKVLLNLYKRLESIRKGIR